MQAMAAKRSGYVSAATRATRPPMQYPVAPTGPARTSGCFASVSKYTGMSLIAPAAPGATIDMSRCRSAGSDQTVAGSNGLNCPAR